MIESKKLSRDEVVTLIFFLENTYGDVKHVIRDYLTNPTAEIAYSVRDKNLVLYVLVDDFVIVASWIDDLPRISYYSDLLHAEILYDALCTWL